MLLHHGVLGTTVIETFEIIKGVIENINPKLLIVIDALASRSIDRISSTIQISDTGIVPGSGVDNTRKELTKETLGIPVIAIGIPNNKSSLTSIFSSSIAFFKAPSLSKVIKALRSLFSIFAKITNFQN